MIVAPKEISYTIQTTNAIESVALDRPKEFFRKAFVYPGGRQTNGTLSVNAAVVTVGLKSDAAETVTDALQPTDLPIAIQTPMATGDDEQMQLSDILVRGTAADSVFIRYWP